MPEGMDVDANGQVGGPGDVSLFGDHSSGFDTDMTRQHDGGPNAPEIQHRCPAGRRFHHREDGVTEMNTFDQGRHPVNIGHLVMGIAFLGLVGVWAIIQSDLVEGTDVRWLLPVPWVFAGIAGLLATTMSSSRRYAVTETGWVDTRSDRRRRGRHQRDLGGCCAVEDSLVNQ